MDEKGKTTKNQETLPDIGFVIYYPFQFFVYKNIYEKLRDRAEFIVDISHPIPIEKRNAIEQDIRSLLNAHGVRYRVLYRHEHKYKKYLKKFFLRYKCLVSVWEIGCLALSETRHIKKVCPTYGVGKELNSARLSRTIYDLTLAYGERDSKLFSLFTKTVVVGNPKFDDWFIDVVDKKSVGHLKEKLDRSKRTVLYLPTYGDLSSMDVLTEKLGKMSKEYNLLVKTHYFTTHEEPKRIDALRKNGLVIFNDSIDLLLLLKVSDLVISDNSSAIFDAILADKPIVLADIWDEEFFNVQHKGLKDLGRGLQGAVTFLGSIEQIVKRDGLVPTLTCSDDLESILEEVVSDPDFYKAKRKELREQLFSYNDGKCAERAADAIVDCINDDDSMSSKPILWHAFEAYKNKKSEFLQNREQVLLDKIDSLEEILHIEIGKEMGARIDVVFFYDGHCHRDSYQGSIRSILEQEFPVENYVIHVVMRNRRGDETFTKELGSEQGEMPTVHIHDLNSDHGTLSIKIKEITNASTASIVCLTNAGYFYPSDWLTRHVIAHAESGVVGVGGYHVPEEGTYTIYDEYEHYEIKKKLNLGRRRIHAQYLYKVINRIYEQNPMGGFAAVSYRNSVVSKLPDYLNDYIELGLYLKKLATKDGLITFMPIIAVSLIKQTFKTYCVNQHRRGFFDVIHEIGRNNIFLSGKSLLGVFTDPFLLLTYGEWKLSPIAFAGNFCYWLGVKRAQIARVVIRCFVWLRDNEKIMDIS